MAHGTAIEDSAPDAPAAKPSTVSAPTARRHAERSISAMAKPGRYRGGMTAQPASQPDPGEPYEVIHLGGQAAAIVPLTELRRLQAVARLPQLRFSKKPRSRRRSQPTASGPPQVGLAPSPTKKRWLSYSPASEDRMVARGESISPPLHGRPRRMAPSARQSPSLPQPVPTRGLSPGRLPQVTRRTVSGGVRSRRRADHHRARRSRYQHLTPNVRCTP